MPPKRLQAQFLLNTDNAHENEYEQAAKIIKDTANKSLEHVTARPRTRPPTCGDFGRECADCKSQAEEEPCSSTSASCYRSARIGQAHRADVMITAAARIAKPCRVMPPSVTLGV